MSVHMGEFRLGDAVVIAEAGLKIYGSLNTADTVRSLVP